jgi:hypothetical protein
VGAPVIGLLGKMCAPQQDSRIITNAPTCSKIRQAGLHTEVPLAERGLAQQLDGGGGRTDGGSLLASRHGGPRTEHARPVSNLMNSNTTASTPEALRVRDQARLECATPDPAQVCECLTPGQAQVYVRATLGPAQVCECAPPGQAGVGECLTPGQARVCECATQVRAYEM